MAQPTSLDTTHAVMYALDRLLYEKCKGSGLSRVELDMHRTYPCPDGVPQCHHSTCDITTREACKRESMDGIGGSCNARNPCNPPLKCVHRSCVDTTKPYLEFQNGKCIYGDLAFRLMCERPKQRRKVHVAGVTDVPPFDYNETTGKCNITKAYCDRMGVSYSDTNKDCYRTVGQQIGELFTGKTIFRAIRKDDGEHPYVNVAEHFAGPHISLYLNNKGTLGFLESELRETYPKLFRGDKVVFTQDDLYDLNKKRVYLTLLHSEWLSSSFANVINGKI